MDPTFVPDNIIQTAMVYQKRTDFQYQTNCANYEFFTSYATQKPKQGKILQLLWNVPYLTRHTDTKHCTVIPAAFETTTMLS